MGQVGFRGMNRSSLSKWKCKDKVGTYLDQEAGQWGSSLSRLIPRLRTAELGRCREREGEQMGGTLRQ